MDSPVKNPVSAKLQRRTLIVAAASALGGLPALSRAQDKFPSKPIKFIVPFGAGSSSDLMARSYAKAVSEAAGQSVIVDNKGGGDGIIGARALLSQPADGYSVLFASNTLLSTNAAVRGDPSYDPLKDFDPLSILQESFAVVAVPAASKFRTFDDLVKFARSNPNRLTHGSGSPTYTLFNAWLANVLGVKVTNIPYKDSGGAAQAIAGGQVDYAVTAAAPLLPLVESGRVRVLLYTGRQRHPSLPSVPTASEAGIKGYEPLIWNAVAVRSGTPSAVRNRLVELFDQASRSEEIQVRVKAQGYAMSFSGPESMHKFQRDEISRWKALVTAAGLKFD